MTFNINIIIRNNNSSNNLDQVVDVLWQMMLHPTNGNVYRAFFNTEECSTLENNGKKTNYSMSVMCESYHYFFLIFCLPSKIQTNNNNAVYPRRDTFIPKITGYRNILPRYVHILPIDIIIFVVVSSTVSLIMYTKRPWAPETRNTGGSRVNNYNGHLFRFIPGTPGG